MSINKATFYSHMKRKFPKGAKRSEQFQSMDYIIDAAEEYNLSDAFLAYIFATTYHETAHTMMPIREYGKGRGRKYGRKHPTTGQIYYGRGYVQLTWHFNYVKATEELGIDFVNNPDLVMEPEHAAHILVVGCVEGWFTGKKLRHTISNFDQISKEDQFEALRQTRRVVNGMDKASLIAGYAVEFLSIIKKSKVVNSKPLSKSRTQKGAGTAGVGGTVVVVKEVVDVVQQQEGALNSGNIVTTVIGGIVIAGALYAAYARWCDAGRPKLF